MATLDDVKAYLASIHVPAGTYTDAVLLDTIAVEQSLQARACYTVAPPEMLQALSRRVYVNLAKRGQPLGVIEQDGDQRRIFTPTVDAEIRRLEKPHRRLVVG